MKNKHLILGLALFGLIMLLSSGASALPAPPACAGLYTDDCTSLREADCPNYWGEAGRDNNTQCEWNGQDCQYATDSCDYDLWESSSSSSIASSSTSSFMSSSSSSSIPFAEELEASQGHLITVQLNPTTTTAPVAAGLFSSQGAGNVTGDGGGLGSIPLPVFGVIGVVAIIALYLITKK